MVERSLRALLHFDSFRRPSVSIGSGTMRTSRLGRLSSFTLGLAAAVSMALFFGSGRVVRGSEDEKGADASRRSARPVRLGVIDQRLREMWDQSSIKPSPVCSEEEFLRRVYLDLVGRIPTIKEAGGYLQ